MCGEVARKEAKVRGWWWWLMMILILMQLLSPQLLAALMSYCSPFATKPEIKYKSFNHSRYKFLNENLGCWISEKFFFFFPTRHFLPHSFCFLPLFPFVLVFLHSLFLLVFASLPFFFMSFFFGCLLEVFSYVFSFFLCFSLCLFFMYVWWRRRSSIGASKSVLS